MILEANFCKHKFDSLIPKSTSFQINVFFMCHLAKKFLIAIIFPEKFEMNKILISDIKFYCLGSRA